MKRFCIALFVFFVLAFTLSVVIFAEEIQQPETAQDTPGQAESVDQELDESEEAEETENPARAREMRMKEIETMEICAKEINREIDVLKNELKETEKWYGMLIKNRVRTTELGRTKAEAEQLRQKILELNQELRKIQRLLLQIK